MSQKIQLIVFPTSNLEESKKLFSQFLGTEPYADSPYYVGFRIDDQEIGLDPNAAKQGVTGPINYSEVTDIEVSLKNLVDNGAKIQQEIKDVGGGKLVASIVDSNGNFLGFTQSPK